MSRKFSKHFFFKPFKPFCILVFIRCDSVYTTKTSNPFHDIAARVNTVIRAGQTSCIDTTGLRSSTHLDLISHFWHLFWPVDQKSRPSPRHAVWQEAEEPVESQLPLEHPEEGAEEAGRRRGWAGRTLLMLPFPELFKKKRKTVPVWVHSNTVLWPCHVTFAASPPASPTCAPPAHRRRPPSRGPSSNPGLSAQRSSWKSKIYNYTCKRSTIGRIVFLVHKTGGIT